MIKRIRPPNSANIIAFMRMLFLRTEQELIQEITRKRSTGLVDYAEVAALERVQRILQNMVDESWSYVPQMIETIFYRTNKDLSSDIKSSGVLNACIANPKSDARLVL